MVRYAAAMAGIETRAALHTRMAAVRRANTGPEIRVRRALQGIGVEPVLHATYLPGTPDLVFVNAKLAVFVHGCFWHGHAACRRARMPKTNRWFWHDKITRNRRRDRAVRRQLNNQGWQTRVVWECNIDRGVARVRAVLVSARCRGDDAS